MSWACLRHWVFRNSRIIARPAMRLRSSDLSTAGANVFGKTNVAAYLIGWATSNEIYGTTNNPWDLTRSPGGSAGGSAARAGCRTHGSRAWRRLRRRRAQCPLTIAESTLNKPTYGTTNWSAHVMPGIGNKPDLMVTGPIARQRRRSQARAVADRRPGPPMRR